MTLDVKPEIASRLSAMAAMHGISVEDYLQQLLEKELPAPEAESVPLQVSGMVIEEGLLVYRTGRPLPSHMVDDALRRSREERDQSIMGSLS